MDPNTISLIVVLSVLGCVCSPILLYPIAILIKLFIWSIQVCCCKPKEFKTEVSNEDPVVVINPVATFQAEQEDPQV